ncbi:MAG: hypothetical protein ACLFPX_06100 [Candidatus Omnitrophota bacterium]
MSLTTAIGRFMIRHFARRHGFMDPFSVLANMSRFGKPAEIAAPTELLRAGFVLQARGLINSQVIQHNLDWVWPYWISRQFDPRDTSFIPRGFAATHINLTHRNWTAVGVPEHPQTAVVDPAGLVMPFWDSWTLDAWIMTPDGKNVIPSRIKQPHQTLHYDDGLTIKTLTGAHDMQLETRTSVILRDGEPVCRTEIAGHAPHMAWLVVSIRPCNPEGISFIKHIQDLPGKGGWKINKKHSVYLSPKPEYMRSSDYDGGDVFFSIFKDQPPRKYHCDAELMTAAAVYPISPGGIQTVFADIPLNPAKTKKPLSPIEPASTGAQWEQALDASCRLNVPDERTQFLYDSAVRTLILHCADDIMAGPFTYKRFWFRDAVFIAHTLACLNLGERAERMIERFPERQTPMGYFLSQEGEWDSNGEVLWLMDRFYKLTAKTPEDLWLKTIEKGANWILRKRRKRSADDPAGGLFPAGFSAEHFGPNDYYYWDDFWGAAGLKGAADIFAKSGMTGKAEHFRKAGDEFLTDIQSSLRHTLRRLDRPGMPASPFRRLDSAAIGSLAVSYPLSLWDGKDERIMDTVEFLLQNCLVNGGFFHDMTHSGINPYLTLHIAQALLRAGDSRCLNLIRVIADMASPTGQWPEAMHPQNTNGCMGDGQHVWAASEWLMMIRNSFVQEDQDALFLCRGILPEWYARAGDISFGPTPTEFGPVMVQIRSDGKHLEIQWQGEWFADSPQVFVQLPGAEPISINKETHNCRISLAEIKPKEKRKI